MPETCSSGPAAETIRVEVVYADAQEQLVRRVVLARDATVDEAIRASGIRDILPTNFTPAAIGIYGRIVSPDARVREGDRIELYRPLVVDPKQARRRRADRQK